MKPDEHGNRRRKASRESTEPRGAGSGGRVPSAELVEVFSELERKIEAAIELISRLKEENRELSRRFSEAERLRQETAERIDAVLDRIGTLT